jgi:hypothetical protein
VRARVREVRAELAPLDKVKVRARVHARLPRRSDRDAFDRATEGAEHAALVDAATYARLVSRCRATAKAEGDVLAEALRVLLDDAPRADDDGEGVARRRERA